MLCCRPWDKAVRHRQQEAQALFVAAREIRPPLPGGYKLGIVRHNPPEGQDHTVSMARRGISGGGLFFLEPWMTTSGKCSVQSQRGRESLNAAVVKIVSLVKPTHATEFLSGASPRDRVLQSPLRGNFLPLRARRPLNEQAQSFVIVPWHSFVSDQDTTQVQDVRSKITVQSCRSFRSPTRWPPSTFRMGDRRSRWPISHVAPPRWLLPLLFTTRYALPLLFMHQSVYKHARVSA